MFLVIEIPRFFNHFLFTKGFLLGVVAYHTNLTIIAFGLLFLDFTLPILLLWFISFPVSSNSKSKSMFLCCVSVIPLIDIQFLCQYYSRWSSWFPKFSSEVFRSNTLLFKYLMIFSLSHLSLSCLLNLADVELMALIDGCN